jgi:hypothetical protein
VTPREIEELLAAADPGAPLQKGIITATPPSGRPCRCLRVTSVIDRRAHSGRRIQVDVRSSKSAERTMEGDILPDSSDKRERWKTQWIEQKWKVG